MGKQAVDEVAADEPRTTDDEPAAARRRELAGQRRDSHFGVAARSAGWLTSRCQTTAHIPSVCAVTRSSFTVGTRTETSAVR